MEVEISRFKSSLFRNILIILFIGIIVLGIVFRDQLGILAKQSFANYYVMQGDTEFKKGNLQGAIDSYNKALGIYPEYSKAEYNLGNVYSLYEDFFGAVECYERSLNINPDFINARINLGIIFLQEMHDINRSINEYISAVNTIPSQYNIPFLNKQNKNYILNKAIAHYNLGLAYRMKSLLYGANSPGARENMMNAIENYRRAIEIQPNFYDAHYNLGLALHLLGDSSGAMQEYCRAIKIIPLNFDAHYNLGVLLKKAGRYRESASELENAGLVLSAEGAGEDSQYVYQLLSDVNQRALLDKENSKRYYSENSDAKNGKNSVKYVKGKVILKNQSMEDLSEDLESDQVCKGILSD